MYDYFKTQESLNNKPERVGYDNFELTGDYQEAVKKHETIERYALWIRDTRSPERGQNYLPRILKPSSFWKYFGPKAGIKKSSQIRTSLKLMLHSGNTPK